MARRNVLLSSVSGKDQTLILIRIIYKSRILIGIVSVWLRHYRRSYLTTSFTTVLRIRDVCPGSRILIFTHRGSRIQKQQQKRGVKKNLMSYLLCSHKFHKIVHYFGFEVLKKKIWANFQRIIELFAQKIVTKLSKVPYGFGIRDPGPGVKMHRIPDPDPQL
jgi:hypothetical protein